ncbi:MAG: nitrilase-related carbon-nitrogen hydrolase [Candidatus Kariarchaeaceae archaeon]|jgi:N-carbamoylputrescine amidase
MKVKCGLIQATDAAPAGASLEEIKEANIVKHEKMIKEAGEKGVQILCLQEIFYGPYFPAEQNKKWYGLVEKIPEGPTVQRLSKLAKEYNMALILPIYEEEQAGIYYNTAAVIDSDGTYLGKYRKNHIPHVPTTEDGTKGFLEKFYFRPGNLGYPVFKLKSGVTIGVYICYDRHFPEGARALALNGAQIVFNPSATVAGLSEYLWKLEQPAHAVANGYFIGAINRVGTEAPWDIGHFYGTSYFCDPRGEFLATGSRDTDDLVIADLDLDMITEVRETWQFFRDRRPDTYSSLTDQ